jgi:hypothetical protein
MWRRKVVAEFTSAVKNRTPDPPPPEEELTVSGARDCMGSCRSSRMYIQPNEITHGKAGKQPAPDRMLLLLICCCSSGGLAGDVGMTIVGA